MIEVVKAEESHIKDICRLWLEFMEFSKGIDPIYKPRQGALPVFERDYLRPAMNSESSLVLVGVDGKKVVGYAYAVVNEPRNPVEKATHGYIHDMFVTEAYRRRDIGGKMYNEIIKWFKSKGIKRIELEVIEGNKYAESFWKKQSYTEFTHRLYREI
jgi:GNAT superfamily N-acetyltransferase